MDYQSAKSSILEIWSKKPKIAHHIIKTHHKEIYELISNIKGKTISEKSWKWIYESEGGKCLNCGSDTKFLDFRRGYASFCSNKCVAKSDEIKNKKKKTISDRYGVDHYSKTPEYKIKFEKTVKSKYGVINPGQIESLKLSRSRNKQLTFFEDIIERSKDISIPLFNFNDYTHVRDKSLRWNCKQCNIDFQSDLFNKLPRCPSCFPKGNFGGQSNVEKDVLSTIREFYHGIIDENRRDIISPKELDLYFPEFNFAIEINGIYWHNADLLPQKYHQEKYILCKEKNIDLLMITDYEWKTKKEIIISMIKHKLKIKKKTVFARKCTIKELTNGEAKFFFNNTHINGFCKASKYYGLVHEEQIIAAISCAPNRFSKNKNEIEIIRFSLLNFNVPGAFSKLFSAIKRIYSDHTFISYADLRYGSGNVYSKNGFEESKITAPGYWYFVNDKLEHRLNWTKRKLVKLGFDKNKTEKEIMRDLNALKIYDCGQKLFTWRKNK